MSSGVLRVLTAIVGAPLVLAATVYGGTYFTVLIVVATLACQYEFYQLGGANENSLLTGLALLAGAAIVVGFDYTGSFGVAIVAVVGMLVVFPFVYKKDKALLVLGLLVSGLIYPATLLGSIVGVRNSDLASSLYVTVLAVVLVWSSDTFAYYVGKTIGKHQLTPISPKKTWEGSVGGVVGAATMGAVLKVVWFHDAVNWLELGILVVICGCVGQLGDIFESKLKRAAKVKDSGSLLPGHGGMLDRLDAIIVVAPLVYVVFVLLPAFLK